MSGAEEINAPGFHQMDSASIMWSKTSIIWHFLFVFPSELIGGTPSLKMNYGSGALVLQLNNNIGAADRRWHRLDVRSNSKVRQLLLLTHLSCL